ncbi:hypothetical protein D3C81_1414100 [compost metagenome]
MAAQQVIGLAGGLETMVAGNPYPPFRSGRDFAQEVDAMIGKDTVVHIHVHVRCGGVGEIMAPAASMPEVAKHADGNRTVLHQADAAARGQHRAHPRQNLARLVG